MASEIKAFDYYSKLSEARRIMDVVGVDYRMVDKDELNHIKVLVLDLTAMQRIMLERLAEHAEMDVRYEAMRGELNQEWIWFGMLKG